MKVQVSGTLYFHLVAMHGDRLTLTGLDGNQVPLKTKAMKEGLLVEYEYVQGRDVRLKVERHDAIDIESDYERFYFIPYDSISSFKFKITPSSSSKDVMDITQINRKLVDKSIVNMNTSDKVLQIPQLFKVMKIFKLHTV